MLSLIYGLLLNLAFAPYSHLFLSYLMPAASMGIYQKASPKQALLYGFLFGEGFLLGGLSWIYISLHRFGHMPIPAAALITVSFLSLLATLFGLHAYLLNKYLPKLHWTKWVLGFPSLWIVGEYVRSTLLTGFPWLILGDTQSNAGFLSLQAYVPLLGSHGVSWLILCISGILFSLHQSLKNSRARKNILITGTLSLLPISLFSLNPLLSSVEWTQAHTPPRSLTVRLIQPNIPQARKWEPSAWPGILEDYQRMIQHSMAQNALIILPEAAIPTLPRNVPNFLNQISSLAQKNQAHLLVGIPLQGEQPGVYYNGVLSLGVGQGQYFKRHLVPFGEYLPFENYLRPLVQALVSIPMSNFSKGPLSQPFILINQHPIATFVCYEVAYSKLVRHDLPKATLLVTLTDDSWFGESNAAAQHLQIAQIRALESGRYMLFATNTGISAIIRPNGTLAQKAPPYQRYIIKGSVSLRKGQTPWGYYGDIPLLLLLILSLGICFKQPL